MSRFLFAVLLACGVGGLATPVSASWDTSRFPDEAKIAFKQGEELQGAGRYKDAIKAYTRSLRHDRSQTKVLNNLAACYTDRRKYKKAIMYYEKSLWLNPKQADVHAALGAVHIQRKRWSDAEEERRILHGLDPDAAASLAKQIEQARGPTRTR